MTPIIERIITPMERRICQVGGSKGILTIITIGDDIGTILIQVANVPFGSPTTIETI